MKLKETTVSHSNATLEDFAAQLTQAAYCVALRHGVKDSWLDVEIELWRVLADGLNRQRFPLDFAPSQSMHGELQVEAGDRRDAMQRSSK
jgi:hypothetical protein